LSYAEPTDDTFNPVRDTASRIAKASMQVRLMRMVGGSGVCDAAMSAGSFARRRLLVAAYGALSREGSLLLAYSVTLSGLAAELHRHHGRHGVP
jgi:hypothetical protein